MALEVEPAANPEETVQQTAVSDLSAISPIHP